MEVDNTLSRPNVRANYRSALTLVAAGSAFYVPVQNVEVERLDPRAVRPRDTREC
jgi:hypothetical protein